MPAFVDDPGGGSPTGGWGILGPEDPPLPGPFILDVLFYSLLLWLAFYAIQLVRGRALLLKLVAMTLPLNILLAISLWLIYFSFQIFGFFGSYTYIGRGHLVDVQVDTPTSTIFILGFSPIVSIPLEDMIELYGNPDYVRLASEGTTETPAIRLALYWDSIRMSVELPPIADKMYVVKNTTDVEMIIFLDEEQYSSLSDIPYGREKMVWKGYGNYQP